MDPTKIFKSRSKPRTITTVYLDENEKEINLEWLVKPLSPRLMVNNYKYFAALEEMDKDKVKGQELTKAQEIETLEKLAPLIDVVLPYCCIKPKIVEEGESNNLQLNIDDLDIQTLMALFSEIFKTSGVSEKKDKERQDFVKPPSPKQLPPSV